MAPRVFKLSRKDTSETLVDSPIVHRSSSLFSFSFSPSLKKRFKSDDRTLEENKHSMNDETFVIPDPPLVQKCGQRAPVRSDTANTLVEYEETKPALVVKSSIIDESEDGVFLKSPVSAEKGSRLTMSPTSLELALPSADGFTSTTPFNSPNDMPPRPSKRSSFLRKSNDDHGRYSEPVRSTAILTARAVFSIAEASNVPYLKGVAGLAQLILEYADAVAANKEDCTRIYARVEDLFEEIYKRRDEDTPQLRSDLERLEGSLHEVMKYLKQLTGRNRKYYQKFIRQEEDREIIVRCEKILDHAFQMFSISSNLHTQRALEDLFQTTSRHHIELRERIEQFGNETHDLIRENFGLNGGSVNHSVSGQKIFSKSPTSTPPPGAQDKAVAAAPPLPPSPKIFHGRCKELEKLVGTITGSTAARIAILGPGGVGKSALSLALLHNEEVEEKFGQRRFFVSCDSANSAESLVSVIASYFGLTESAAKAQRGKEEEIMSLLRGDSFDTWAESPVLSQQRMLIPTIIVLDNFESPWEASQGRRDVEDFLGRLSDMEGVTVIVTMRGIDRPSGVAWSRPFLPPLCTLDPIAARSVFIDISDANYPDRHAEDDEEAHDELDELLELCEFLPLAIELLANLAQPGMETVPSLLERWKREVPDTAMLDRGDHRRDSLNVSIEISLNSPRISQHPEALTLLQLLALLPDGVRNDELELAIPSIQRTDYYSRVLRQTSLAYLDSRNRLKVLAPIRAYVSATHKPKREIIAELERYFWDMLNGVESIEQRLHGCLGEETIRRLMKEVGNIEYLISRAFSLYFEPRPVIAAAVNLGRFYLHASLGKPPLIEKAFYCSKQVGDKAMEAACLYVMAKSTIRFDHGRVTSVETDLREALHLYEESGDDIGRGNCMHQLASVYHNSRDLDKCRASLEKAREIYCQAGNLYGQALTSLSLGRVYRLTNDTDQAISQANSALKILSNALTSPVLKGQCLQFLGEVHCNVICDYTTASRLLEESLKIYKDIDLATSSNYADALVTMGELSLTCRAWGDAKTAFKDAISIYRKSKRKDREAYAFVNLGQACLGLRETGEAAASVKTSLDLWHETSNKWGIGISTRALGDVERVKRAYGISKQHYTAAMTIFKQDASHWRSDEADCLFRLALLTVEVEENEDALRYFDEAFQLYRMIGQRRGENNCLFHMAKLRLMEGCVASAIDVRQGALFDLRTVHRAYKEMGLEADKDECERAIAEHLHLSDNESHTKAFRDQPYQFTIEVQAG